LTQNSIRGQSGTLQRINYGTNSEANFEFKTAGNLKPADGLKDRKLKYHYSGLLQREKERNVSTIAHYLHSAENSSWKTDYSENGSDTDYK
jgi:uncharacterized pyridoxal phosphate-containing UPF0001 family protein